MLAKRIIPCLDVAQAGLLKELALSNCAMRADPSGNCTGDTMNKAQ